MICSPESTIACVLDLSEDKTVHCRLLSNLKVRSNLQDSVVTQTKWSVEILSVERCQMSIGMCSVTPLQLLVFVTVVRV